MNRENVITFSTKSHLDVYGLGKDFTRFADALERFAQLVAAHEREACAQVCEAQENRVVMTHPARVEFDPNRNMARKCAAAIRARGEKC